MVRRRVLWLKRLLPWMWPVTKVAASGDGAGKVTPLSLFLFFCFIILLPYIFCSFLFFAFACFEFGPWSG